MNKKLLSGLGAVVSKAVTAMAQQAQTSAAYIRWMDPNRRFSLEVPRGWITQGGSYIDSISMSNYCVSTRSPDGSMVVTLGDTRIVYAYNSQVVPPMSGKQVAEWYYQNYIAKSLPDAKVDGSLDYNDGSGALGYIQSDNIGIVYARTRSLGRTWQIVQLYNIIAPRAEIETAKSVVFHMIATTIFNNQQHIKQHGTQYTNNTDDSQVIRDVMNYATKVGDQSANAFDDFVKQ